MSEEVVKILVPSYQRAKMVLTTKAVANCTLVVPESQVEEYKKYNKGVPVVGHPNDVKGISNARQWIYDTYGNVFMLDDDIKAITRLMQPPVYSMGKEQEDELDKVSPELAYDIIQHLADTARQAGIYLFGFTSAVKPRDVHPQKPFSINSYVKGTTMGLLKGSKLHFPSEPAGQTCEDHYVTLLNAFHHRWNLIDNRFGFIHVDTFKRKGGCSDYRTSQSEEESYKYLKKKFGKAVRLKGEDSSGMSKRTHRYERVLQIPY
jgi:hypothetical protein